jgi:phosphate transport system permease protein
VLLTSGVTAVLNFNPFSGPMISLPLQVFNFVRSSEPTMQARGFGTAAVLVILVLGLFFLARILGGRGPGQLSDRQRRKVAEASARDLRRITLADDRVIASAAAASVASVPAASAADLPAAYPKETSS